MMSTPVTTARRRFPLLIRLALLAAGLGGGLLGDQEVSVSGPGTPGGPPPPPAGENYLITARPVTPGAVRITSTPSRIDCLNNDNTSGDRCVESFAANTDLRLLAAPQPGHAFLNWRFGPCDGSASTECRFTVTRQDSARAVTEPVVTSCPTPPVVAVNREVPTPPARTATYGTNLLANGTFSADVHATTWPESYGFWRGDDAARVPSAQQGITPVTNDGMLQFIASTGVGPHPTFSASEQMQLVDVRALETDINAGAVVASAEASFARVGGCAAIDTRFNLMIIAFDGPPAQAGSKYGAQTWLGRVVTALDAPNPAVWEPATAVLRLPPGTSYVAVLIAVLENVVNDATFPEFHGHYADNVSLILTRD